MKSNSASAKGGKNSTPYYINFVLHNEREGANYADPAIYDKMRRFSRQLGETIVDSQAALNFQSDYVFLENVISFEGTHASPKKYAGKAETHDLNIIEWLNQLHEVATDPHAHDNPPCNYTDVAYLHEQLLGYPPRHLMGGFVWDEGTAFGTRTVSWLDYADSESCFKYSKKYTWRPVILWGAARHDAVTGEKIELPAFGAWKPKGLKDLATFTTHAPGRVMTLVSRGCIIKMLPSSGTGVYDLDANVINPLRTSMNTCAAHPEGFFMQSIIIQAGYFTITESWNDGRTIQLLGDIPTIVSTVNAYAAKIGIEVRWRTIQGAYNYWHDVYRANPYYLDLTGTC